MTRATGATTTPRDDGFYCPADDYRHAQMWLPWPREKALRGAVADLVRTVMRYEPVSVVAAPGEEGQARAACGDASIASLAFQSARLRDIGPTFLVDGKGGAAAADWRFNGWGGRRPVAAADEIFAHELLGHAEIRRFRAPLTLEGSAFVADGAGTVIALAGATFDSARNPGLAPLEAFAFLQHWLNAARVIWLDDAAAGDPLCADVRAQVAFVAPGTVVVTGSASGSLARARDARGGPLSQIALPAPTAMGSGLMSYTNFVPINGGLLVPTFDAPTDDAALASLAQAMPGRTVEPIPARVFAEHGISLSSLMLPQPARLLQRDRATTLPRSATDQPIPDIEALLQKYIDMARER